MKSEITIRNAEASIRALLADEKNPGAIRVLYAVATALQWVQEKTAWTITKEAMANAELARQGK